jgi:hypothetical protein
LIEIILLNFQYNLERAETMAFWPYYSLQINSLLQDGRVKHNKYVRMKMQVIAMAAVFK